MPCPCDAYRRHSVSTPPPNDFPKACQAIQDTHREASWYSGDARRWRLKACLCQLEALALVVREEIEASAAAESDGDEEQT